ncbi:MAG: 7TM diverse intracellular signaling domain-containing protein, partial [Bacteroidota bacterium]
MLRRGYLQLLIVLLQFSLPAWGQTTDFLYLTDSSDALTPAEIFRRDDLPWRALHDSTVRSRTYPLYVSFRLGAVAPGTERWITTNNYSDTLALYANPGRKLFSTGTDFWPRQWPVPYDARTLPLPTSGGRYLLRSVTSRGKFESLTVFPLQPTLLEDERAYFDYRRTRYLSEEYWRNGQRIFLLILALIILGGAIAYGVTRQVIYGAYVAYALTFFGYYLFRRWELVDPNQYHLPSFLKYSLEGWWSFLIFLTYTVFVRRFLGKRGLERSSPWVPRILKGMIILSTAGIVICVLALLLPNGILWSNVIASSLRPAVVVIGLYFAFLLARSRDILPRLVAGGITVLVLGMGMIVVNNYLRDRYAIDLQPRGISFLQLGILGELLFYLLAINWRRREIERTLVNQEAHLRELKERQEVLERELRTHKTAYLTISLPGGRVHKWAQTQVQGFMAEGEVSRCLLDGEEPRALPIRLGELTDQLPANFLRVHRSYVVNVDKITRLEKGRPARAYLNGRSEP